MDAESVAKEKNDEEEEEEKMNSDHIIFGS